MRGSRVVEEESVCTLRLHILSLALVIINVSGWLNLIFVTYPRYIRTLSALSNPRKNAKALPGLSKFLCPHMVCRLDYITNRPHLVKPRENNSHSQHQQKKPTPQKKGSGYDTSHERVGACAS